MRRVSVLVMMVGLAACGGSTTKSPSAGGNVNGGNTTALGGGAGDQVGGSSAAGSSQDPVGPPLGCVPGGPHFECSRHSDCGNGKACLCRPDSNESRCVPADCRADADCPDGGACLETITGSCPASSTVVGMYCTTPMDSCDGRSPAKGLCGPDAACRYDLVATAYTCYPLCGG